MRKRLRTALGRYAIEGKNRFEILGSTSRIALETSDGSIVWVQINTDQLDRVVNHCRWVLLKQDGKSYAQGTIKTDDGRKKTIRMHRFILGVESPAIYIDHIDGDGLNNTTENLRLATNSENQQNTGPKKNSKTGVRGVSVCGATGMFKAQLSVGRKYVFNKRFHTLKEAELALNYARQEHCSHLPKDHSWVINLMSCLWPSEVNGPGQRFVVWTQSCPHRCKNCFNESSWSPRVNTLRFCEELAEEIKSCNPDGLTLSGGDPLVQPQALLSLLKRLHDSGGELQGFPRGIIVFTGFTIEEIEAMPGQNGEAARACLNYIDLLIDGRYVEELRYTDGLAGSRNQRFHFSRATGRGESRVPRHEIEIDQEVEIHAGVENTVEVTGFPAIDRKFLNSLGLRVLK